MQIITCLFLLTLIAINDAEMTSHIPYLVSPSVLLQPSIAIATLKDLLTPSQDSRLSTPALFGPCEGYHEAIYDIDYDDTYTVPYELKKGKET